MNEVHNRAENGDWEGCQKLIAGRRSPVYNVVRAGLLARRESRETLESVLQEAILKELPRLERALPLLNIMGAVCTTARAARHRNRHDRDFRGDQRLRHRRSASAVGRDFRGPGDDHAGVVRGDSDHAAAYRFESASSSIFVGDMEEKSVTLTNIIHRLLPRSRT